MKYIKFIRQNLAPVLCSAFLLFFLGLLCFDKAVEHTHAQSNPQGTTCVLEMLSTPTSQQIVCVPTATLALSTGAVGAGTCDAVQSVAMPGLATSSTIELSFASNPLSVTGYGSGNNGISLRAYPTAGSANILECNYGSASITPGAMTINLRANP